MARIQYTTLIMELVGKLAGSVFQDSYGGFQVRTRVSPANPQSNFQQLRRGEFAFLTSHWRNLTPPQVASWVAEAGSLPAAFRLYVSSNINASLIGQPLISTFVSSAVPGLFPISIASYDNTQLSIIGSGSPNIVPIDRSLLIQATYEKRQTKIFTNPSQFSPIIALPPATDLSTALDITAVWVARFGILRPGKRLCVTSSLIAISNGLRGPDSISCANSSPLVGDLIIDSNGDILIDMDGTFITFP